MADTVPSEGYRRDRVGAADQVRNDLRAQILSGRLPRGTRLPSERELAAHYEVSAPTIREAVRALSAMSLVEARHGAGTFVTAETRALLTTALSAVIELENVTMAGILELSEAVYRKAVELGVRVAGDAELVELRALAEAFRGSMDNAELAVALRAFLAGLVSISHNRLLIGIADYLVDAHISLAQGVSDRSPSAWRRIAGPLRADRVAIVDALLARDRTAADDAVLAYLKRGEDLVRRYAPEA